MFLHKQGGERQARGVRMKAQPLAEGHSNRTKKMMLQDTTGPAGHYRTLQDMETSFPSLPELLGGSAELR